VDELGHDYQTVLPQIGGKIGEVLLAPHISYLKPLIPLVDEHALHALAHITGGGLTDNVPRVLPDSLDAVVKLGSWPVLPILKYLFEQGKVEAEEMLRVFNMGIGMVVIAGPDKVDRIARHFGQIGQKFFFIGNVAKGSGRVRYDAPPSGFASWIE
jgi:phosphoribosylformylglycinamidine cyclo-ligase